MGETIFLEKVKCVFCGIPIDWEFMGEKCYDCDGKGCYICGFRGCIPSEDEVDPCCDECFEREYGDEF